jgi:hypothetical protein
MFGADAGSRSPRDLPSAQAPSGPVGGRLEPTADGPPTNEPPPQRQWPGIAPESRPVTGSRPIASVGLGVEPDFGVVLDLLGVPVPPWVRETDLARKA